MSKKKKHHKHSKHRKKINYKFLLIPFLILIFLVVGIFQYKSVEEDVLAQHNVFEDSPTITNELHKMKTLLQKEYNKVKELTSQKEKLNKELKKYIHSSEAKDYEQNFKNVKVDTSLQTKKKKTKYPKLAIIIDDVANNTHVKRIKSVPYKITPSIFPPSPHHPNTQKLAKQFRFFMVHLPTQAMSKSFKAEVDTLNVNSSKSFIEQRIKNIKKWFPKVTYVNNHTGSKFTSDFNAMVRLFTVLDKYDINFLDSRTTPKSKSLKVAKLLGKDIFVRDIFLDHKIEESYTINQLKKAVHIAKRDGLAIAIGHPHKSTIAALKKSTRLLNGVEVVYVNEI
jgi:polysaccharide deacetylase 2 family uncharacterized protein YibQ